MRFGRKRLWQSVPSLESPEDHRRNRRRFLRNLAAALLLLASPALVRLTQCAVLRFKGGQDGAARED